MPTYCTLADAYGPSWGSQNNQIKNSTVSEANKKREEKYNETLIKAGTAPQGDEINNSCPNCKHCLEQNNQFQQKVVEQAIRPLPRWVPQEQNIQAWDPFTRYFPHKEGFGNIGYPNPNPFQRIEHFGNITTNNASHLIQLVLYLLIALFMIQLLELLGSF